MAGRHFGKEPVAVNQGCKRITVSEDSIGNNGLVDSAADILPISHGLCAGYSYLAVACGFIYNPVILSSRVVRAYPFAVNTGMNLYSIARLSDKRRFGYSFEGCILAAAVSVAAVYGNMKYHIAYPFFYFYYR